MIRLFGFEISRISKLEREEEKVFKQSTLALNEMLIDFLKYLGDIYDKHDDEPSIIQHMFEFIESITSALRIYSENKYASPLTTISMNQRIQIIRTHGMRIQHMVSQHHNTRLHMENFQDMLEEEYEDDDEYSQIQLEMDHTESHYERTLRSMIRELFADVNATCAVLQYDVFRIIYGVDIVKSYKKKTKLPKGTAEYSIKIFTKHQPGEVNTNGGVKL